MNMNIKKLFIAALLLSLQSCLVFGVPGEQEAKLWEILKRSLLEKTPTDSLQDLQSIVPEKLPINYVGPLHLYAPTEGTIINFIALKAEPGKLLNHLRYLLSLPLKQEDINTYCPNYGTPLSTIIWNLGKTTTESVETELEKIKLLLKNGAQVNILMKERGLTDERENELHRVVEPIISILTKKLRRLVPTRRKKPRQEDREKLIDAVLEVVQLLVEHGVDEKHRNAKEETPLDKLKNALNGQKKIAEKTKISIIEKFEASIRKAIERKAEEEERLQFLQKLQKGRLLPGETQIFPKNRPTVKAPKWTFN